MPKKLAITVSGAVSLGSYEAGVLYEVIRALGMHNSDPATVPDDAIYIDVLTGASAGGMTATIAAQKLMYEAEALDGAETNAFYLPWVAEIGIERLLQTTGTPGDNMSIFSSQAVVDISKEFLTARYNNGAPPAAERHPALDPDNLKLGLAMTNLNGLDYGMDLRPTGKLIYTEFADQLVKEFDVTQPAADDTEAVWEALRNTAVSCGAFPLAFKVVEVARQAQDFAADPPITPISNPQNFSYTDGGVFQNEPVSLAKLLVDKIDEHQEQENRFFLFVAPDLRNSAANSDFNAQTATLLNTAKQLAGVVFNQGRFPDLLQAEELNEAVALLDARVNQLLTLLNAPGMQPNVDAMRITAGLLLPKLFEGEPEGTLEASQDRLKSQYANGYRILGQMVGDVWIDSILTLERAAGLGETDMMTIYSIIAADTELASTGLEAFAGFFDRRCREHDYQVGRQKAQTFLKTAGVFGLAGALNCTFEIVPVPDPALDGLKLADMDKSVRENVRDRLIDRANELMKEAGVNWFLAGPVVRSFLDIFIKEKLNDVLRL